MIDQKHIDEDLYTFLQTSTIRGRTMLLPALHKAQSIYGWLPREVLSEIGRSLHVPLAEIHGVVEFYSMFYNHETSTRVVRICEDPACSLAGAHEVLETIENFLGLKAGETREDLSLSLEKVPCLGMCEHAPAGLIGSSPAGSLSPESVSSLLADQYDEPKAKIYGNPLWLLERVGNLNPESLEEYRQNGGYITLQRASAGTPEALIESISAAKILGRGGAMFPFGRKLAFTRAAPGTPAGKHIIVNADESEPGTFKDRCLLEEDPFAVIEAATLAAYAVGAENGWIFIRGEYPRAYERICDAVGKARTANLLGKDILGHKDFNFDVEVRLGAGAYICGEETALFEAIEGKRGFPRIKPPFPTTHGLFDQPTAINNVETLLTGLTACRIGIEKWKSLGTSTSPGTKLFCLSGHVNKPGVYEVPFGKTIRELIAMAGGVPSGRPIEAVLMGGAAGIFIDEGRLDTRLTYEDLRAKGIPLGSGVIQVFDDTVDLRRVLYQLSRFFAHESCGKCFPCQLGTQRQMEILHRIFREGKGLPGSREALSDIGNVMAETSLCGLGQTAASAVLSALHLWPELIE